jgi:hypothetical protein
MKSTFALLALAVSAVVGQVLEARWAGEGATTTTMYTTTYTTVCPVTTTTYVFYFFS